MAQHEHGQDKNSEIRSEIESSRDSRSNNSIFRILVQAFALDGHGLETPVIRNWPALEHAPEDTSDCDTCC